jgi:predicted nucleic acid-binding protein
MIILDTNVLSGLMADPPDQTVINWLDRQARESTWTSSITVMEIRFELERMARGRRHERLEAAFRRLLDEKLDGRVAVFDEAAADATGVLMAANRAMGRVRDIHDTMISGIAIARRAAVATRNVRHFENVGIDIINPWRS